jgi:HPt (histidine-containing phosphotransfer) domain-containing protein
MDGPPSAPWDLPAVMARFLNKAPIILKFMAAFETRVCTNYQKILTALASGDQFKLGEGISAIKGSAGILSSTALMELSVTLEKSAKAGDMVSVKEAMPRLEAEIQRCRDYFPQAREIISAQA